MTIIIFYVTIGYLWESAFNIPLRTTAAVKCINTLAEESLSLYNILLLIFLDANMSLQPQAADALEERSAFFIGADSGNVSEEEDHHELILQKANALASENCLREAIDWFSAAMRYSPVQPEQLSTFVDCILRNFKRKAVGPEPLSGRSIREAAESSAEEDVLECPNCHCFLGEPVTLACGHSYCKRCLQRRLLDKCKLCSEHVRGEEKVNVILCGLLSKWFPEEVEKSKKVMEVDALCRRKRYQEAVELATDVIQSGQCC